jgi:hypothetical protein
MLGSASTSFSSMNTPEVTHSNIVDTSVSAPQKREWTKFGRIGGTIGALSTVVVIGAVTLFKSAKSEGSPDEQHTSQRVPLEEKTKSPVKEVHAAPEKKPEQEKPVIIKKTPDEWKKAASESWEHLKIVVENGAMMTEGIKNRIEEIQIALENAGGTGEEMGFTPEAIKELYINHAKKEWGQVLYFKDAGMVAFQSTAFNQMKSSLQAAGATKEEIGVTDAMVEEAKIRK